jgi:hypothetical protein
MIEKLAYRSKFRHKPNQINDVFDSRSYRRLLQTRVVLNGERLDHTFFSDHRDIAFAFSGDGFQVFENVKQGSATATPLLAILYNFDPAYQTHQDHVLPLGVIPGKNQPKDLDSFLIPFRDECIQLAKGITTFDAQNNENFVLHAYPLNVFGDMIFMEKLMRLKGHNGFCPCRACQIQGVRHPSATTYYVPLRHPTTSTSWQHPRYIPKREHTHFQDVPSKIRALPTQAARKRLARYWGINDTSILINIPSLSFPTSFPHDFMHLLFENIVPNLIDLWTGSYKGLPQGSVEYQLPQDVWEQIGRETEAASSLIPSAFCGKIPNIENNRRSFKAELYSFWLLYLAPILLYKRFPDDRIYNHMMLLVDIIKSCLQMKTTFTAIDTLEDKIVRWVRQYEEYVFLQCPKSC